MKALYIDSYGDLSVMKLGELPRPGVGSGEVLVEVRATSVNPIDWKIRRGDYKFLTGRSFPKVLGGDVAGVVVEVGPGEKRLSPGDTVYGFVPIYKRRPGALAELVSVPTKHLRRKPEGLSFEHAAALPGAALTALNGLRQCGPLDGRRVLVNGATGGVGHFAVQIAKARGATVSAVCSARNEELARTLGADEVIDYRETDVSRSEQQWDAILDAHGHMGFRAVRSILSSRGTYATTLPTPSAMVQVLVRRLMGGRRLVLANMRDRPEDYAELERLLAREHLSPLVEGVYPLEQATDAFSLLEQGGKVRGKLVIRVA